MSILSLRKFVSPEIIFGVGSRKLAGTYAKNFTSQKIMIVTDPGIIKAGWVGDITKSLEKENLEYIIYSKVSPNPREIEVMEGAELYKKEKCSLIIAIGGGSPMDCAKGIGIVSSNGGYILNYEGIDNIKNPSPPLIFIPTTSGTAADISQFAIISDRKEFVKRAIISKAIVPDIALVDPETTISMDKYLTACTGIDALVHAIEAYVSIASSPITDIHAIQAIKYINEYLPKTIREPNNIELREKISLASMEAGLAFSNAILGAVHAMAHSLGGFLDLPHGECNAILLEHIISFNYNVIPDKYNHILELMGINTKNTTNLEKKNLLINKIINFKKEVGITKSLSKAGVKISDIPNLSKKAFNDPCLLTNPRKAKERDIEVLYEESL